jgi:serine/threonine protein kinase
MCTLIPRERPNSINLARYQLTGQTGSIRYMAPEVATNQLYNQSVDVYSFALISWGASALVPCISGPRPVRIS